MKNGAVQLKCGKRIFRFKMNGKRHDHLDRKNNHSPESSQNQ